MSRRQTFAYHAFAALFWAISLTQQSGAVDTRPRHFTRPTFDERLLPYVVRGYRLSPEAAEEVGWMLRHKRLMRRPDTAFVSPEVRYREPVEARKP